MPLLRMNHLGQVEEYGFGAFPSIIGLVGGGSGSLPTSSGSGMVYAGGSRFFNEAANAQEMAAQLAAMEARKLAQEKELARINAELAAGTITRVIDPQANLFSSQIPKWYYYEYGPVKSISNDAGSIRLSVTLGNRIKTFTLPSAKVVADLKVGDWVKITTISYDSTEKIDDPNVEGTGTYETVTTNVIQDVVRDDRNMAPPIMERIEKTVVLATGTLTEGKHYDLTPIVKIISKPMSSALPKIETPVATTAQVAKEISLQHPMALYKLA